jgi:threonine dehydrogenase-like Zn-dependent dehydrogenase
LSPVWCSVSEPGQFRPVTKIVFGGIGIGARGTTDLRALLSFGQAKFVAICDVRNERREEVKSMVDQKYGNRDCQMYDDQYALLARPEIDAVLIATGDRWHTPLAIIAAQHGKMSIARSPAPCRWTRAGRLPARSAVTTVFTRPAVSAAMVAISSSAKNC